MLTKIPKFISNTYKGFFFVKPKIFSLSSKNVYLPNTYKYFCSSNTNNPNSGAKLDLDKVINPNVQVSEDGTITATVNGKTIKYKCNKYINLSYLASE
jgi:hypothetical protein